jgi:hypothetical protein
MNFLHPSTDPKPLWWGRLLELTDLREETDIHPFIGDELLHVVFSASWLDRNEQPGIRYHRFAEISIYDRVRGNTLREEDGFTTGDFMVEVVVTSEGAYARAKLLIHVEENFLGLRMKKLSRFEILKLKFMRYIRRGRKQN